MQAVLSCVQVETKSVAVIKVSTCVWWRGAGGSGRFKFDSECVWVLRIEKLVTGLGS